MSIDDLSFEKIKLYSDMYNILKCVGNDFYTFSFKKMNDLEIDYYMKLFDNFTNDEIDEYNLVCKFLKNRYAKKCRYYKYIDFMLNNYKVCYFCTFTFNEESIILNKKYCRKVLTQMLKSLNTCYIGNVDFGDLHGRLHYHVIIAENEIHINKDSVNWSFGWYDIKVISNKDSVRLGSYIMKLVNHATKASTKDSIITPRGEYGFNNLMKNIS